MLRLTLKQQRQASPVLQDFGYAATVSVLHGLDVKVAGKRQEQLIVDFWKESPRYTLNRAQEADVNAAVNLNSLLNRQSSFKWRPFACFDCSQFCSAVAAST